MSGKGAKGLITGKTSAANKDKDKKKPISRSSRAGLQVLRSPFLSHSFTSSDSLLALQNLHALIL